MQSYKEYFELPKENTIIYLNYYFFFEIMVYNSKNRHKFLLKCHLIFVCKYRRNILDGKLSEYMKQRCMEISKKASFEIEASETDKNHIHFMITYHPNVSVSSIVRKLKQETTHSVWKDFPELRKIYWKEHTFWSDGYFVCSIGDANSDTIRNYIENQG